MPARVRTIGRLRDRHQTWGGFPPVWEREDEAERLRWLRNYRWAVPDWYLFAGG